MPVGYTSPIMPVANDTAFVAIGRYDDQLVAGNSTAEHHIIAIMLIDHKMGCAVSDINIIPVGHPVTPLDQVWFRDVKQSNHKSLVVKYRTAVHA